MTDLTSTPATEAAAAIREGSLTARALVDAYLERIAVRDEMVGAWIHLDPEHARAQADAADAAREKGDALGPLHGVPIAFKDIIDTRDMPTANGSALFAGRRPVADATLVRLARDAGAIIMGKAVTTEFALTAVGKTKNPHDSARTPGGSSSGSAAAVADHQVPLSIGSQTGGSMLRPASFCGCYGFKPTFGSISRAGMFPLSRVLDHPGIYANSLADVALLADVLMQRDPADLDMRGHIATGLGEALHDPGEAPRIAFVKGPPWDAAEPYLEGLFTDVMQTLGDTAREVALTGVFDTAIDCHTTVMLAHLGANIGDYCRDGGDNVQDETKRRCAAGDGLLAADYVKAIEYRDTLSAALDRMFDHADVLITASAPGEAPEGLSGTGNPIFQKIWTLTGVPTLSLPKLTGPNGMPIGVQVIGRFGKDADLFRHANWIDTRL